MRLKYVSHNYFSASLRQLFLFLSVGREGRTTVATLQLLLAKSDFLNAAAAALGTLPARWLELYISPPGICLFSFLFF